MTFPTAIPASPLIVAHPTNDKANRGASHKADRPSSQKILLLQCPVHQRRSTQPYCSTRVLDSIDGDSAGKGTGTGKLLYCCRRKHLRSSNSFLKCMRRSGKKVEKSQEEVYLQYSIEMIRNYFVTSMQQHTHHTSADSEKNTTYEE